MYKLLTDQAIESDNYYIKFPDGTLICSHKATFPKTPFVASGSCYRATINNPFTFPVEFIDYPVVICNTCSNADYMYSTVIGVLRNKREITQITLLRETSGTGEVNIHYIAIGRFK